MEQQIGTLKAIIVDDEPAARRSLQTLLQQHCPNVVVVDQCASVPLAVLSIRQHKPDVVFLDIEMPEFDGFELTNFFDTVQFEIVFVTAYNEYALQAFECSAVDYILKPVQVDKLKNAVQKVAERRGSFNMIERAKVLQQNLNQDELSRIALPVSDGLLFVEVANISTLQADGAYTIVWMTDGSKLLVSKKLKFFEDLLCRRKCFFRIHRSYLVNLNYMKKYNRLDSDLEMDSGLKMSISKERKKDFEAALAEIRVGK